MAKSGTLVHRKTRRLAHLIANGCLPFALGIVEALWHLVATSTPCGGIGRLTNEEIADGVWWPGDPNELIDALVAARFLEISDTHRIVAVGWSEHAPDFIHAKLYRAVQLFADGTAPRANKVDQNDRNRLADDWAKLLTNQSDGPENSGSRIAKAAAESPKRQPDRQNGSRKPPSAVHGPPAARTIPNLTQPNLTKPNLTKPNPTTPGDSEIGQLQAVGPPGGRAPEGLEWDKVYEWAKNVLIERYEFGRVEADLEAESFAEYYKNGLDKSGKLIQNWSTVLSNWARRARARAPVPDERPEQPDPRAGIPWADEARKRIR